MKALVCAEPFDLRLESCEPPRPAAGEVLLRMRRVGPCGTDYHIMPADTPSSNTPG